MLPIKPIPVWALLEREKGFGASIADNFFIDYHRHLDRCPERFVSVNDENSRLAGLAPRWLLLACRDIN
jgi:hypothetical protein